MSAARPSRSFVRRALAGGTALVATVGALVALAPAASAADPVGVIDLVELRVAVGQSCNPGTSVRLDADILQSTQDLTTDCTVTIDLNDKELRLRTVSVGGTTALTVTDQGPETSDRGLLTTSTSQGNEPGIRTTGATLSVSGQAAISAVSEATGGAGIGGENGAPGGIVIVSGSAQVAASGSDSGAGIGGGSTGAGGRLTVNDTAAVTATGGSSGGAGIGGGRSGGGGATTVTGGTVSASGGGGGAGIGGGAIGGGGRTTVSSGTVTATSRGTGAGIGGGQSGGGGETTVNGGVVTATGGARGAGIGSGERAPGGQTTINGGTVTATGGAASAGIGGGALSRGGQTTVNNGTVTARGGDTGAGIGGGDFGGGGITVVTGRARVIASGGRLAAGIGGGSNAAGGTTTISGDSAVTTYGGENASGIGPGFGTSDPATTFVTGDGAERPRLNAFSGSEQRFPARSAIGFGQLTVSDGVVNVPEDAWRVERNQADSENRSVIVEDGGVIESRQIDPGTGEATSTAGSGTLVRGDAIQGAAGRVVNGGSITLPTASVDPLLQVTDHHYRVTFDANGGQLAAGSDPVTVYAESFTAGARSFPEPPTRGGSAFLGWNTARNGSGTTFTESSVFSQTSTDGGPVEVTLYAQFPREPQPPTPQPPAEEPLPAVTVSVDGQSKVGERLTASASLASGAEDVSYAFQWLRDGSPIAGADSRSYRPRRADIGREVSVEVTASAPGRTTSSDMSRGVAVRPVVGIVGVTRVGRELTPRAVVPEGARATYRWETSEPPARGQQRVWEQVSTADSYTLRGRDARQRVRLIVTISGSGFSTVTSYSPGRYVRR